MVTFALPLWLIVVLSLALVILLVGALYGFSVFASQLVGGQVDFEGAIPVDDLTQIQRDHPEFNERLRGVDPRLADDLMRDAETERGRKST